MRTQARRLRGHASVAAFFISSDELPPAAVEALYRGTLAAAAWPNGIIAAASAGNSSTSGPTGVKMSGPYSWVSVASVMLGLVLGHRVSLHFK